jgi:hypothetical protein
MDAGRWKVLGMYLYLSKVIFGSLESWKFFSVTRGH